MPYPFESSSFDTSSLDEIDLHSLGLSLGEPTLPVLGRIPSIPTSDVQVFVDESHRVTVRGPAGLRSSSFRRAHEESREESDASIAETQKPKLVDGPKPFRIDAVTDSPTRFAQDTTDRPEITPPIEEPPKALRRIDTPKIAAAVEPTDGVENTESDDANHADVDGTPAITTADRLSYEHPQQDPSTRPYEAPTGIAGWLIQLEAFTAAYSRVIMLAVLLTATGLTLLLLRGGSPAVDSLPAELPTLPSVDQTEMANQTPVVPGTLLTEEAEPFLPPLQLAQRPAAVDSSETFAPMQMSNAPADSARAGNGLPNNPTATASGPTANSIGQAVQNQDGAANTTSLQAAVTGPPSMTYPTANATPAAYPRTGLSTSTLPVARGPESNRVESANPHPVATLPGRIQSPSSTYSPR